VKPVLLWVSWWVALFWLWLLLAGEWNREQIVAAALAATLAATVAEFARARTGFRAPMPLRLLADLPEAIGMVVVDFGILVWALLAGAARRRAVHGELITRELDRGSWIDQGTGPRAWTVLLSSYSPNAYVVDVDTEARRVLVHDLIPKRASEKPV
jgi:hypothetical protein